MKYKEARTIAMSYPYKLISSIATLNSYIFEFKINYSSYYLEIFYDGSKKLFFTKKYKDKFNSIKKSKLIEMF